MTIAEIERSKEIEKMSGKRTGRTSRKVIIIDHPVYNSNSGEYHYDPSGAHTEFLYGTENQLGRLRKWLPAEAESYVVTEREAIGAYGMDLDASPAIPTYNECWRDFQRDYKRQYGGEENV